MELIKLICNRRIYQLYKHNKRFAGHSKWANIKHVKQEKDNEKMLLFHHIKLQMKIAIQDGGSTKPTENLKLAQLIEHAKKINMPFASIKNFLEKMEARKNKTQKGIIQIRGPGGCIMLVRYTTDNVKLFQMELNQKLKKSSGKVADPSTRNMFTHIGSIIVEKKGNLEQATESAIIVGAQDVEEFEENSRKYFQFKCEPKLLNKIKNLIEACQYCVLSAEEDYVPRNLVELSNSDLEKVSYICEKILSLEDVSHIHDNIA